MISKSLSKLLVPWLIFPHLVFFVGRSPYPIVVELTVQLAKDGLELLFNLNQQNISPKTQTQIARCLANMCGNGNGFVVHSFF